MDKLTAIQKNYNDTNKMIADLLRTLEVLKANSEALYKAYIAEFASTGLVVSPELTIPFSHYNTEGGPVFRATLPNGYTLSVYAMIYKYDLTVRYGMGYLLPDSPDPDGMRYDEIESRGMFYDSMSLDEVAIIAAAVAKL